MQKGVIKKRIAIKDTDPNDKDMLANFQAQNEWVRRNTISSTPTVLTNGYLLPEEYELKDMSYLIN